MSTAFPCNVCHMSRNNSVHKNKQQFKYHEFEYKEPKVEERYATAFSIDGRNFTIFTNQQLPDGLEFLDLQEISNNVDSDESATIMEAV